MNLRDLGKLALTSALGLFLSSSFVFLAALPIRYLRLDFGRWIFLLVSMAGTAALYAAQQWQWALVYLSLSFLVGVYSELELQKLPIFASGLISVMLTAILSTFTFGLIARQQGFTLFTFLDQQMEPLKKQLAEMPQLEGMGDMQTILFYLPSGLIISLMVVLFITLVVFSDETGAKNSKLLKAFTLPDSLIWFFIASLAGTFLLEKGSIEAIVAVNVLSISLAAYFFQGLAVISSYLDHIQVFGFWRMLVYFIIFFQMFIVVSGIGILDFWVGFRQRLQKKKNLTTRREERS